MKLPTLYMNHWLHLHPYKAVQPSDAYYVELANRLLAVMTLPALSVDVRCRLSLYLAAYLEDQVSGLKLWQTFLKEHQRMYGSVLPFYAVSADYFSDEVNPEDVAFLLWNTWQKEVQHDEKVHQNQHGHDADQAQNVHDAAQSQHAVHLSYVNPLSPDLLAQASALYDVLAEAYEEAPENSVLEDYFHGFATSEEADVKLDWLFGRTYLTEPAMMPYIANVTSSDRFIIPTGPLALFLYEWIDALGGSSQWKSVKDLYLEEPELPAEFVAKNQEIYAYFTAATQGSNVVFLNGYPALKDFLVNALHWPDDENHTMPQLSEFHDFVLMVNRDKGMLLAKDVCRFLAAPGNSMYDVPTAQRGAFRLLTEETVCPPDLLVRSITEGWLPDLQLPGDPSSRDLVVRNADFIARHSLLYYYRGD